MRRMLASGLTVLALVIGLTSAFAVVSAPPAQAITGADFKPGNIISDAKFFDGNAMNASDVQSFLNSQVPNCRAGYTCLKGYTEVTFSRAADPMCGAYNSSGAETAAQIITKVGNACGISQKVLLVLLQKEQSLVTDSDPSAGQFRSATGFACPDTAPCDAQYYGFYNQVYKAAWQYKRYTNPPGTSAFFTWYPVGGTANILYNPDASCGSSPVYIENKATAGLYYYTPYQPNATALSNLYGGQTDGCSSYGNRNFWRLYWDWFGNPTDVDYSPVGSIDSVTNTLTTATLSGWTFDPETAASIQVHVYAGLYESGAPGIGAYTANTSRPDVAKVYPAYGPNHGFSITVPLGSGTNTFCLYAINVGQGNTKNLGCRDVAKPSGSPIGNIDSASIQNGKATVAGWAVDPDSSVPIKVHVYVNGAWGGEYSADRSRPDVGNAKPGYGAAHGFQISGIGIPVGTSTVCVFGIDAAGGQPNSQIGCRTVSTASGPPKGTIDQVTSSLGQLTVAGWALDPDTPNPIDVHVYVNGAWGGAVTANASRKDIASAFPGYGESHGYSLTVNARGGPNTVCVYGINVTDASSNPQLGCTTVDVPGGNPIGNLESVTVTSGIVTVQGWTIDPDSADPVAIHVYDNGGWIGAFTADASRPDVGTAYPQYGAKHGFALTFPAKPGSNRVCVYGINTGYGDANPAIGCAVVTSG